LTIPASFLLGLVVLLIHEELGDSLPVTGSWVRLIPWLVLLPVPWLLSRLTMRSLGRVLLGPRGHVRLQFAFQIQAFAVPFIYYLIMTKGGLPSAVTSLSLHSIFAETLILLAPLLIMESILRLAERSIQSALSNMSLESGGLLGMGRLRMALFVTTPILLFAGVTDLVFLNRRLEVFLSGTSLGTTLGLVLMVLLLCAVLPLVFRLLMSTTTELPDHLARDLRQTASQLGFPPQSVLAMDTGYRAVNAALVGPLPRPRYLVLTDGLLSVLDSQALRGVVAHEVGHARAGHPALLLLVFGGLPLLSLQPLFLGFGEASTAVILLLSGLALGLGWVVLRTLAHRFEFEADLLSAEALGGAQPCIDALRRVGELSPQNIHRASLRHPSEQQRIACLLDWESDPLFRTRFKQSGRRLRHWIAAVSGIVLIATLWAQVVLWPVDRAIYLFYTGDFPAAQAQLAQLDGERPAHRERLVEELTAEANAAIELLPDGGEWREISGELSRQAYDRGTAVLIEHGPKAARTWFALALSHRDYSPMELSLYMYCSAALDGDAERMHVLRDHILQFGVDRELARALGV
jgi:Zn-dependent protease with chaperone function